ncbi:MAG: hypothetical protein GF405_00360 [Candidatus Eisenbacteria bacterium]|nr:hypothetical protein [Candidatus Eisenbacteria bacterium]
MSRYDVSPAGTRSVLAARLHESAGTPRTDDAARDLLLKGVRDVVASFIAAPPEPAADGAIVIRADEPEHLLDLVRHISDAVRPEHATFGLAVATGHPAVGSLDRAVVGADAVTTAALTALLATGLRNARVAILAPGRQPLLESLISLMLEFTDRMTERQRQIISLVRSSETQQQVAQHLGVSRQAVNQSLTSAGWQHIRRAEDTARDALAVLARERALES